MKQATGNHEIAYRKSFAFAPKLNKKMDGGQQMGTMRLRIAKASLLLLN